MPLLSERAGEPERVKEDRVHGRSMRAGALKVYPCPPASYGWLMSLKKFLPIAVSQVPSLRANIPANHITEGRCFRPTVEHPRPTIQQLVAADQYPSLT